MVMFDKIFIKKILYRVMLLDRTENIAFKWSNLIKYSDERHISLCMLYELKRMIYEALMYSYALFFWIKIIKFKPRPYALNYSLIQRGMY